MVETSDPIHPLVSPSAAASISGDRKTNSAAAATRRKRHCCIYTVGFLLITAAIIVTLTFTVFRFKPPIIRIRKLKVGKLDLITAANVTLTAVVWVRNPNFASLTYGHVGTTLLHGGAVVGEASAPPGTARSRRTTRVDVTAEVMTDRILSDPDLDVVSGLVNFSSYTRVGGRMRVFVFIEKELTMRMSCNVTFNITSRSIEEHRCKRKVKLFKG